MSSEGASLDDTQLISNAFNAHTIRTIEIDGQPWFVAVDICRALGVYLGARSGAANVSLIARDLAPDETMFNQVKGTDSLGRKMTKRVLLVSESGLYQIIMRAQRSNPAARQFQDWVTRVVLPALRKDGDYMVWS